MSLFLGCQGADGPATSPVSGSVTMAGQPVAEAIVTFVPTTPGDEAKSAQSETDTDGHFEMSYSMGDDDKPGLPPGEYGVAIQKLDLTSVRSTLTPPKSLLPQRYGNIQSSGLTANVQAGENNNFSFELTE